MGRIGDPFSETLIQFVIDRDRIWRIRLALQRWNDTPIDPIMDDPEADAILVMKTIPAVFGWV